MNSFQLKNIKAFHDSGEIKLKPITILVGKNSSGKSSLLRFPAVLSQTANSNGNNPPVSFFGDYIDYGNFEDVVFGHQGNELSFSLSYDIDISRNMFFRKIMNKNTRNRIKSIDNRIKKARIDVSLMRIKKSINVQQVDVFIENKPLSSLVFDKENQNFVLKLLSFYNNEELSSTNESIMFNKEDIFFQKFFPIYVCDVISRIAESNNLSISNDSIRNISKYDIFLYNGIINKNSLTKDEKEIVYIYQMFDFASDIMGSIFESYNLESQNEIAYIGPFRQNPGRIYRYSETTRMYVGPKGENIGDILVNAYQKKENDLFKNISDWLYKYFEYHIDIKDLGGNYFQIMLKDRKGNKSNIIDVGFGISQVLPIISEICLMANHKKKKRKNLFTNNIVLIEQPELHLHPAAQAGLAELFAMCVSSNINARLFIETHSEHLISKLQVLIADKNNAITSDMVQILYVDKKENGEAYIKEMEINENGKFKNLWPTGFFDQAYNLSYELMKNLSSRSKG